MREETEMTEMEAPLLCDADRQPCEVWTRVMGYFRPISEFNIGKKSEYADRKYFSERKAVEREVSKTSSFGYLNNAKKAAAE